MISAVRCGPQAMPYESASGSELSGPDYRTARHLQRVAGRLAQIIIEANARGKEDIRIVNSLSAIG
jgi:hypothetical protein